MSNGNATASTHVLDLTSKRRELARQIVTTFDAFDWQQTTETGCDVVHIEFQTRESLDAAMDLFMQLAAHDDKLALRAQEKLELVINSLSGLQVVANPNVQSTEPVSGLVGSATAAGAKPGSEASSPTEAESLLEQVKSDETQKVLRVPLTSQPMEFYLGWKQVNGLLQKLEALQAQGIWFASGQSSEQVPIVSDAESESGYTHLPSGTPLPPFNFGLVGLGPVSDTWLQVPLGLALGGSIVGLARRIVSSNTGISELPIKPNEEVTGQLLLRLFSECKPSEYRVAGDDFGDPYASVVQQQIDEFVPLLRELVTAIFGDSGRPGQPAHSGTSAVVSTTGSPAVHAAKDSAEGNATVSAPPNERQEKPKVEIWVGHKFVLKLNGTIVSKKRIILTRALLGIAALAGDGATEVTFDTKSFIDLIYRNAEDVSGKWGATWVKLHKEAGLQREGDEGQYRLFGFKVQLDQVTQEEIRKHLISLPPRVK